MDYAQSRESYFWWYMTFKVKLLALIAIIIGSLPIMMVWFVYQRETALMTAVAQTPGVTVTLVSNKLGWGVSDSIYRIQYQFDTHTPSFELEGRYHWEIKLPIFGKLAQGNLSLLLPNTAHTSAASAIFSISAFWNGKLGGNWHIPRLDLLSADQNHGLFADNLFGYFAYQPQDWQIKLEADNLQYQDDQFRYTLAQFTLQQNAHQGIVAQPSVDFNVQLIETHTS